MELKVDGNQIGMNAFVQKVVTNLTRSILDSLDDVPENPQAVVLDYSIEAGVEIRIAERPLRMNEFVQRLTENVLMGILLSLDDVPPEPHSFRLSV